MKKWMVILLTLCGYDAISQDTVYIFDIASQSLSYRLLPAYNVNAVSDSTNPFYGSHGVTSMPDTPPLITYPSTGISLPEKAEGFYSTFNFPFTAVTLIRYGLNITSAVIGRRALLAFHFDVRQAYSHWRSLADANPFYENGIIQYGFTKLTPVKYYLFNSPDGSPTYFSVIEVAENIGDYSGYFGLAYDTVSTAYDSLLLYNISYPNEGYPQFYSSPLNGDTMYMKYGYINPGLTTFQACWGGDGEYVSPFFDAGFRLRGIRWSFQENYFINRKNFYYLKYVLDSLATSIPQVNGETAWSLFPNPASSTFTIQINSQLQNVDLEIFNLTGGKIYSGAFSKQFTFDCEQFPSGIYFVKLQTEKGSAVEKLVIQK